MKKIVRSFVLIATVALIAATTAHAAVTGTDPRPPRGKNGGQLVALQNNSQR